MEAPTTDARATFEESNSKNANSSRRKWCAQKVQENLLVILTLVGVAVGFAVGFGVRTAQPSNDVIMWVGLPGEVYMRMMKMLILPMIICMVIAGTGTMEPRSNGRISLVAFGHCAISNAVGVLLGIAMYKAFNPGGVEASSESMMSEGNKNMETQDIFADFIRNMFPSNLVSACFESTVTRYDPVSKLNMTGNHTEEKQFVRNVGKDKGTNVLGLIVVSALLGITTSRAGEAGRPFLKFFQSASDIIIMLLELIIWFTPVGVISLIATSIITAVNLEETFTLLGMLALAVTLGVAIFELIVLPLGYLAVTRSNPLWFLLSIIRPWVTAFGPPSSALAMPVVIEVCETKHHVDPRVTRCVVPIVFAFSAAGSCIFIGASTLFVAELSGKPLTAGEVALAWVLITLCGLALPAVPSASIVTIVIVLTSLDVGVESVGLLLAMEWYMDRIRTTGNAMNMTFGAILAYQICKNVLKKTESDNDAVKPAVIAPPNTTKL